MKISIKFFVLVFCIHFLNQAQAQELKINQIEETELSKSSKSGRYAGTFTNGNNFKVLYLTSTKKEGIQIDQYDFDTSLKFSAMEGVFVNDSDASKEFVWYIPKEKINTIVPDNKEFIKATSAFGGGMKMYLGYYKKSYYLNIYTGMTFVEEKKLKPKTGDIWRILPSGFKTLTQVEAISTDAGFAREQEKYGNPLIAPADTPILAAGVITEKIKTKGPWKSHGNRIAVLAIDGANFDATKYNIYPLPYSAMVMGAGLGQSDNLCSLFAPLNAPSTVKELQHFRWKEQKDQFTLMRFSDNYELVDSITYTSDLLWGSFHILNGNGSTVIIGLGKASYDGWARNANGIMLKKVEDIQISQFIDGELIFSKTYTKDLLESKIVVPEGEKVKSVFGQPHKEYFKEIIPLANGDSFVLAQSGFGTYALQISPSGELTAYYRIPRVNNKGKSGLYNYQINIKGNEIYLVLNEQLFEFSNDTQIETSTTRLANSAGSFTTTTVKKLNEVFLQSHVIKINTKTHKMSNRVIMDGEIFYTIGSYPAIFTENAIYFTGRDKGPKGKKIFLAKIDFE